MPEIAKIDASVSPPAVEVPRDYNATVDFIDRHLGEGRGGKVAVIDDRGEYTYAELAEKVNRAGNMLKSLGVGMEQRVFMCMLDAVEFMAVFWGAIKIGAVPVPVNTLLTGKDYDYMVRNTRAGVMVVSAPLFEKFEPILDGQPFVEHVIIDDKGAGAGAHQSLDTLLAAADTALGAAPTVNDDAGFWLFSSGSTGAPKGAVHLQTDMLFTSAYYGQGVLGIREDDVVFSAAKLFFAYGLGNGMTFPLQVGATAVLMAERPTPGSVLGVLKKHEPTIYYGVPTLYGAILADPANDRSKGSPRLRACVSAGEALPKDVAERWVERFGVDILDGLGSTEMLHIFLSNQHDKLRYGTSGVAVPGYELKVVDEDGTEVPQGEIGELLVSGPSSAVCYFNNRPKSLATFEGPWTRTGDKYTQDEDGFFVYAGRTDDMLKVGGIWVSPFEVESALVAHDSVLEAAVVGQEDADELVKPKAFIVLKEGEEASDTLSDQLKLFVKDRLAPYKYPRWIEFRDELPKTATGKIQRFKLRQ